MTLLTTETHFAEATLAVSTESAALPSLAAARREGRLLIHTKYLAELNDSSGFVSDKNGPALGPFSQLVLATGTAARPYPAGADAVGDCVAPRGLWSATADAARLVANWSGGA